MAKGKAKQVEIKDLPILNIGGKNYYAFNVALRYLKQNNKEQFKGMTQKKFKEVYGEHSLFKLTGNGSWISVELFNELSCKLTKVVVKTLDQEIRWKEDSASLGQLFFVKDEVTAKAHKEIVSQIPTKAMESLEKFEAVNCDSEGERLLKVLDNLIESCKDFHAHGHTSVRPYLYEKGYGYLIGEGVFVTVSDWTYDYKTYTAEEAEEADGWQLEKVGKLCRYVESFGDREEHMQEFVKAPIDFTGMNPRQAILECFKRNLFVDDCDWMNVECGSIDVSIDHNELLSIIGSHELPSHLDKKGRLVDLTDILAEEGIVIDDCKDEVVINDTYEYESQVIDAEFVEVIEGEVVEYPSDFENQAESVDVVEIDKI